jgi:hypothetical protein
LRSKIFAVGLVEVQGQLCIALGLKPYPRLF